MTYNHVQPLQINYIIKFYIIYNHRGKIQIHHSTEDIQDILQHMASIAKLSL